MVNYNNSTIYKLCCNDLSVTDIYVGSTTNFKMRKHDHKSRYNNELGKSYNLVVYYPLCCIFSCVGRRCILNRRKTN